MNACECVSNWILSSASRVLINFSKGSRPGDVTQPSPKQQIHWLLGKMSFHHAPTSHPQSIHARFISWLWLITLIIIGGFLGHISSWWLHCGDGIDVNACGTPPRDIIHRKAGECERKMMDCLCSDLWLLRWYKSKRSHESESNSLHGFRNIIYYHYSSKKHKNAVVG